MPIRILALIVSLFALAAPAFAADANHDIKGLYLLTDYPAVTVQPGTTSTVSLKTAQLRAGARAARAVGFGRAAGLDRDAARRRPADRGGHAGDRRQRVARSAARRAEGRQDRHAHADGHRRRRRVACDAAGGGHARQGIAGQADAGPAIARTARLLTLELRIYADHQERQRQEAAGQPRRRRAARISTPRSPRPTARSSSRRSRSTPARPRT